MPQGTFRGQFRCIRFSLKPKYIGLVCEKEVLVYSYLGLVDKYQGFPGREGDSRAPVAN